MAVKETFRTIFLEKQRDEGVVLSKTFRTYLPRQEIKFIENKFEKFD